MKRIIALALALVLSIGCAAADNKNFNIRFFKDNASFFRFTEPEGGNSAFIETLETAGLIHRLDRYMWEQTVEGDIYHIRISLQI